MSNALHQRGGNQGSGGNQGGGGAANRNRSNRRRSKGGRPKSDVWRTPAELPEMEPIVVPNEVGALLRSLGDPPMTGGTAAGHYFASVIERAAAVGVALALSADLLAEPGDD